MRDQKRKATCCNDENGARRPYHLCCPACRAAMDAAARRRLLSAGTAPADCSRKIPVAPARGPVLGFSETVLVPRGDDWSEVEAPYRAGRPGRVRDIFDVMTDQGTRRGGPAPFTLAQVDAGRAYRDLFERVDAAGVKCSRAFDDRPRGQGAVDFMDVFMGDRQRLERFAKAIGDGLALTPRRHGAHTMDRGQRRLITDATLARMVCLEQAPLRAVLQHHGWSLAGKNHKALLEALCAALDRMQGI